MTAQRAHLWVVLLVASTAVAAPTEQKPTEVQDSDASPSASPLITDGANKGFRMPGLYGFGTKPFYLERDPETGAFDFSAAAGGSSQNKYSSKVPAHADYDYEEVAIDTDPIDRKDTLGPVRPNDLGDIFHKPSKTPQVPLISSSYASTKLQGMGVSSKQEPTSTTTSPSYYSQWPIKSTTEVLDFWPPQKPTTEATPEYYDYEEVSAEVSETVPPSPSPSAPATTMPPFEYEPAEESETVRPIPPKKKQDAVKKPELPLVVAPEIELLPPVEEEVEPEIEFRPQESEIKVPELEMRPPHVDFRPAELPDRPTLVDFRPAELPNRPSLIDFRPAELPARPPQEFRPPHQPSVRPLETEMRPPLETPFRPPQGVPLPPRYEPERPQLDTQGWKQAQTPPPVAPPSISSTRLRFPEVTPTTPVPFRQNLPQLPQGYEPIRPPPPHFRIPNRPPHPGRRPPPPDSPYAFVEAKPIDRIHYESRPHPPPPQFRYRPYQNKQGGVRNRNDDQPNSVPSNLPNILPQFRPNANHDPDKFMGFRQPPPPAKRLQPPAGPLVGRRVGSEVSTLQMMKGSVSRPPPRDDAPHHQPPPPPTIIDSRPVGPADRADGPGVFVVYANSKNNDVHVGSRGPQRPLPPNRLLQERPILQGKSDFPYALEKPVEPTNLQDAPPPSIIKTASSYPGATPTVSTVVRPHSVGSEFTVSAVMHAGPGGAGHQGQVFVVAPQHRPEPASSKISNDVITGTNSHHHHHHKDASESGTPPPEPFLAPFHASTNVAAPAPGNGWLALRESEIRTKGIVERADIDVSEPAQETSRFDIENFSPQLIGGFQPIMPEEPAASKTADEPQEKKVEMQTADRQE